MVQPQAGDAPAEVEARLGSGGGSCDSLPAGQPLGSFMHRLGTGQRAMNSTQSTSTSQLVRAPCAPVASPTAPGCLS